MPPAAISDHGLIGDTRTGALCASDGTIDWLCAPRFDSDPLFSSLLTGAEGGRFVLAPEGVRSTERRYVNHSAVLQTRWQTSGGVVEVTEGMVADVGGRTLPRTMLLRRVSCRGRATLRVLFDPRRGLPGTTPHRSYRRNLALVSEWGSFASALQSSPELDLVPGRERLLHLHDGDVVDFILTVADREPLIFVDPAATGDHLDRTASWWRRWSDGLEYDGSYRDCVVRSLLTLRLLTYAPSGAPVAALTTSLPEEIGGSRNWDYRFSWPRDASIGIAAFLAVGRTQEAHAFMHWLLHASRLSRPRLDVLYTLHGQKAAAEQELWDVVGYRGSLPVRIGNAASAQHQLDVYGWVVDAATLLHRSGQRLHGEMWRAVRSFVDFVAENWRRPDAGVWEIRDEPRHYVHSKLMAWLALARGCELAQAYPLRRRRFQFWRHAREAIAADVHSRGFDDDRMTYLRSYGSEDLDAALLLLPVLDFDPHGSPRVSRTIDAIRAELDAGGGLLYRYRPGTDGSSGAEGAFLPCSFWLVQALARTGRIDEAHGLFERLLGCANDVGLYSEELDPATGEQLGNVPQALTHAALIQAAIAMERAKRD